MTPIRPSAFPPIAQPQKAEDAARLAAQRAFFAAAKGGAAAPAAAPARMAAEAQTTPEPRAMTEATRRSLRPGSLIDIKV